MEVHSYDEATGEYLASRPARVWPGRESLPDDAAAKYQMPAHATPIAPPDSAEGFARVLSGGAWLVVPDHRGQEWFDSKGNPVAVTQLGDPSEFTPPLFEEQPPPPPPPLPTADDVWAECRRRKWAAFGAADQTTFDEIRMGGIEEATALTDTRQDREWTAQEITRAAQLRAARELIVLFDLTATSLAFAPPADYDADHHWPPFE